MKSKYQQDETPKPIREPVESIAEEITPPKHKTDNAGVQIRVPVAGFPHASDGVSYTAQVGGKLYRGLKAEVKDGFVYLTGNAG